MIIENAGWSEQRDWYCDKYYVDENKTDYEIKFRNGFVSRQVKPFQDVTMDWNHDGDVYSLFVGGFQDKSGQGFNWWQPTELVRMIIDGDAEIDGIYKM